MSTVVMVGVSHRTAPLPLLENVTVPADHREEVLGRVRAHGFSEAVLLVTCSRTEIYACGQADPRRLVDILVGQAVDEHTTSAVRRAVDLRTGADVAPHLFRVTAGLESRVVGEPDVRCQVRASFRHACRTGTAGGVLGELFSAAVRTADQVHRETSLGSASRSLATRAVHIGLSHTTTALPMVAVVGSGRMASTAVHRLHLLGHTPYVVARDQSQAIRLVGASHARPFSELGAMLRVADIVICTTSAREPLVTAATVTSAMNGRPAGLTLVDLSVPRNVDPSVAEMTGVHLVDLEGMHDRHDDARALAGPAAHAERLVRCGVERYRDNLAARRAGPLIAAMRARVESRCLEVVQTLAAPAGRPEELARMAHTLAGRLAHRATMTARAAAAAGDDAALLTICDAFDIALTPDMLGLRAEDLICGTC